jgi:nucleoside-diphosphate-sugar epimerase
MKIAILGGAGFLGTRLVHLLDKSSYNYFIGDISIKHLDKNYTYLDVEDPGDLEQLSDHNVIINLAAIHRDDVRPLSRYSDVNVQGAVNICEKARKFNINKIIFTSSVAIYGFAPPNTDESGDPNFFNEYGKTKYLAEEVYKAWQEESPEYRTLVIVRPTVIFGEGNRGNVYNLLNQIASKRFVMFGDGRNKKSMAYVENVAAFIEYSLSFKSGLYIYNYIDKPDMDMNTLISQTRKKLFRKNNVGIRLPAFIGFIIGFIADLVTKLIGRPLPVSRIRVKKFMGTTQFNSSIEKTGFKPVYTLSEGLERTLQYEFVDDNSSKVTFETE